MTRLLPGNSAKAMAKTTKHYERHPGRRFTSENAPRQGGKVGRKFTTTLIRKNLELQAAAKGANLMEFMLGVANDETIPLEIRMVAARDTMPYTYPRKSPEVAPPIEPSTARIFVYLPANNRDSKLAE